MSETESTVALFILVCIYAIVQVLLYCATLLCYNIQYYFEQHPVIWSSAVKVSCFVFFFTALLLLPYVLVLLLSVLSLHLYHQKGKGSLQLPVCNTSDEEAHSVLLMLTNTMAFSLDGSETLASLFHFAFKLVVHPTN